MSQISFNLLAFSSLSLSPLLFFTHSLLMYWRNWSLVLCSFGFADWTLVVSFTVLLFCSPNFLLLFSRSIVSNSLWPHGPQHARLPCPSPSPGACSNSHPLSRWCHPNISSSVVPFSSRLQSFPASGSSPMSALRIRWPKDWSFSFSIIPSNEYSGLISFRIDWFDLLAVQGTLKSLLQHHSSKASILWHSAFFVVQLSHPYMTTGKSIALTRGNFVSKVMSLLLNTLSRRVIAFLPRSKYLLISCKSVDLEALLDLYLSFGATSLEVLHVFSSYKGFSCTPHILIYCVFINIVFKKIFKFSFSPVSLFLNFLNSDLCCSFRASTIF